MYFFVLFFCLLLHLLAVRISLPFHIFIQVVIVLIQLYNWEIRHHSFVCRCGLADILYIILFTSCYILWLLVRLDTYSTLKSWVKIIRVISDTKPFCLIKRC